MTQRQYLDARFALKFANDATGEFGGYASTFGGGPDRQGDIVEPGAFAVSMAEWKASGRLPPMLWQHDTTSVIGSWTSIAEDDIGLAVSGRLALEVQQGREAYALLKMGAISGLSIGYSTEEAASDGKTGIRRLIRIKLWEISVVTLPANEAARVNAVKAAERIKTIRDFEAFLRDEGGFSHAAAKAIAWGGFKAKPEPREEDGEVAALMASIERAIATLTAR
ncbi:MAG: HK97 family phage prohead protease [Pseudomonadota bacterium]